MSVAFAAGVIQLYLGAATDLDWAVISTLLPPIAVSPPTTDHRIRLFRRPFYTAVRGAIRPRVKILLGTGTFFFRLFVAFVIPLNVIIYMLANVSNFGEGVLGLIRLIRFVRPTPRLQICRLSHLTV